MSELGAQPPRKAGTKRRVARPARWQAVGTNSPPFHPVLRQTAGRDEERKPRGLEKGRKKRRRRWRTRAAVFRRRNVPFSFFATRQRRVREQLPVATVFRKQTRFEVLFL